MTRRLSRGRFAMLAASVLAGAFLLQLGPCLSALLPMGAAAFDVSSILDENGLLFGLFAPCGTPDWRYVDENGDPVDENIRNTQDDLIYDCPVRGVQQTGG